MTIKRNKIKTIWCFVDGEKHCDVIQWALAANMHKDDAKKALIEQYPYMTVTFKTM